MTDPNSNTDTLSRSKKRKPVTNLELLYSISIPLVVSLVLLGLRLSGQSNAPGLLIFSLFLSLFSVSMTWRIFYPLARWTTMKVDGEDLNLRTPPTD